MQRIKRRKKPLKLVTISTPSFTIGQAVQLMSGGPVMTVERINEMGGGGLSGEVTCIWFNGGLLQRASFGMKTVAHYQAPAMRTIEHVA